MKDRPDFDSPAAGWPKGVQIETREAGWAIMNGGKRAIAVDQRCPGAAPEDQRTAVCIRPGQSVFLYRATGDSVSYIGPASFDNSHPDWTGVLAIHQ